MATKTATSKKVTVIPTKKPEIKVNGKPRPNALAPEPTDPVAVMEIGQVANILKRRELQRLCVEAYELKQQAKAIKERLEGIKANPKKGIKAVTGLNVLIASLLRELNIKTVFVQHDDGIIENTFVRGTSKSLSKDLLLENGVDLVTIQASYTEKEYITSQTKLKGESSDE